MGQAMKKALILARFQRNFHNYRNGVNTALQSCFPPTLRIKEERDDPEQVTLTQMQQYDVVILYCASTWGLAGNSDFITNLITYLLQGGSIMILHVNSLGETEEGGAVFGGRFCMHPPFDRYRMIPAVSDDPVLRGVSEFFVEDEMHMLFTDMVLEKEILLYCEYAGEGKHLHNSHIPHHDIYGKSGRLQVPAAWKYHYGMGRVMYICPGHHASTIQEPSLQRLITNGLFWLLHEIDNGR